MSQEKPKTWMPEEEDPKDTQELADRMRLKKGEAMRESIMEKGNYDDIDHSFEEGMIGVEKDGKWGFVNEQSEEVVAPQYDAVGSFLGGVAEVEKDGKCGFINKEGEEVVPLEYDEVKNSFDELVTVKKDGKWGFVSKKGEEIIPLQYDNAGVFGVYDKPVAGVIKGDESFFIDKEGNRVVE